VHLGMPPNYYDDRDALVDQLYRARVEESRQFKEDITQALKRACLFQHDWQAKELFHVINRMIDARAAR